MEEATPSERSNTNDSNKVEESIFALLAATTWDQLHTILLEQKQTLLSDAADKFFAFIVEHGERVVGISKDTVTYYRQLLDLLRRCREIGIDSAMEEFEMPLIAIEADYQAVGNAYIRFLEAHLAWSGGSFSGSLEVRAGHTVRDLLEQEKHILLSDTMDIYLQHIQERGNRSHQDDDTLNQYRTLFRQARQRGIDKAWREYIQVRQGKDWTWVKLFEIFDEWTREYSLGKEYSLEEPHWGSTAYDRYRNGRRFLEEHAELLAPDFFEGPLNAEITQVEEYVSSYMEGLFKDKTFLHPSLRSDSSDKPFLEVPVYRNSRERSIALLKGQSLLRDSHAGGGTSQVIRETYVNAYGAFTLDLPTWIEDVLKQLDVLQEADESKLECASLLRDAFIRAQEDPNIASEVVVELGSRFIKACKDDPRLDSRAFQLSQIALYTEFLKVYTRERYPYQWALLQKELGNVYAERTDGGSTADRERFIQCYEAALQVIDRKTSQPSWDLTEYNRSWAQMQNKLGSAYSTRASGDRIANLTRAAECLKAALLVYTLETNLYAHRDMQLDLAFLYSREWVAEALQRGDRENVQDAYRYAHEAFAVARQAHLELSWREYYFQNRIKNVVTWSGVRIMYAYDAWCLWQLGDLSAAVATLEDGRAQALAQAQAIAGTVLDGACEYHTQQFLTVRQNWDEQLAKGTLDDIRKARETFLHLRDAIREHCKPDFLPEQAIYRDIAQAAPDHALVYIMAMEQRGVAFIVPPTQRNSNSSIPSPIAVALPKLTWRQVHDWLVRLDDKRQRIVGGYQFALQRRGIELLQKWLDSAEYEREQERLLAVPLRDLPTAISPLFATLRTAISNVVETWGAEADHLSLQTDATAQRNANELRTRLTLTLQETLEKKVLTADLNWFLLEAELEQLQQDLSETFVAELRRELDHLGLGSPNQPIALIPCGQLGMLPIHAAWVGSNPSNGERIPFLETCELTYQASARSLASARKALVGLPKLGPVVAIGNPRPTDEAELHWAEAEAQAIVALAERYQRTGSRAIVKEEATLSRLQATLQTLREKPSGAWIQIASHGNADPTDPTNCYMLLSHNEKLTLADLQRQRLLSGLRGFNASGCVTAVGDLELAPDELSSFAAGVLQAGSPCAVATLWTVKDIPTFLLMLHFTRGLFRTRSSTPTQALREATHWLRTATYKQLGDLAKRGVQGVRSVSQDLTTPDALRGVSEPMQELSLFEEDNMRLPMKDVFPLLAYAGRIQSQQTKTPYRSAVYWAAAVIYGV